jgi:WD40 repeat protein
MFLATAPLRGTQVSLWDISGSPTCVTTRSLSNLEPTKFLVFSRDGRYLAVATATHVEIWSLPNLEFVRSTRLVENDSNVFEVEFNYLGDKYLTVTHGDMNNKLQVWPTEGGVCELTIKVPDCTSAHFLASGEILYMVGNFEEDEIEAYTVNTATGRRVRTTIRSSGDQYGSVLWDYIERAHAVIVTHKMANGTVCMGRWNFHDDAFMWRREGFKCFSPFEFHIYRPIVCSEGRRIVVYGRLNDITIDVLCTESGASLGFFPLAGCRKVPALRFLPVDHHAAIISWVRSECPTAPETCMLSVHNFLTNERTWEEEVDCKVMAIQPSMGMVLM